MPYNSNIPITSAWKRVDDDIRAKVPDLYVWFALYITIGSMDVTFRANNLGDMINIREGLKNALGDVEQAIKALEDEE